MFSVCGWGSVYGGWIVCLFDGVCVLLQMLMMCVSIGSIVT